MQYKKTEIFQDVKKECALSLNDVLDFKSEHAIIVNDSKHEITWDQFQIANQSIFAMSSFPGQCLKEN